MAIESLFDDDLEWHPGLTEEQILEAKSKGIYEPVGPEYEQFLSEVGIDKNNLDDKGIVTQDKVFLESDDPVYEMAWHPELTQEQILYALEKDIYEPVGQEYEQFLKEMGLEPVGKKGGPGGGTGGTGGGTGGRTGGTGGGTGGITGGTGGGTSGGGNGTGGGTSGGTTPGDDDDLDIEDPKKKKKPRDDDDDLDIEDPKKKKKPRDDDDDLDIEDPKKKKKPRDDDDDLDIEDPKKKKKPRDDDDPIVVDPTGKKKPPVGGDGDPIEDDPEKKEPPIDDPKKKEDEEEETYHVVRVERRDKSHLAALLIAAALAASLVSGFYVENQPLPEPTPIVTTTTITHYQVDEIVREMVTQNKTIEDVVYSFLAQQNLSIGDKVDVGQDTPAYYYGNLTGRATTVSGEQAITGFCLYSPDNEDIKYEYSFYEDRALDGTPDRTSVQGLGQNIDVSLEEFLAKLDVANYNIEDIRFSLHMGKRGWVKADELVKVNGEKVQIDVPELVEVIKQVATYKGSAPGDVDFANIAPEGEEPIWVKLTDDDTDELFPAGTIVEGTDGKQYVISSLERETIETEHVVEGAETEGRLRWSITDCDLALAAVPLVAGVALAVATAIKNKKNKENPNFFEFENDEDYLRFKNDFEKAREEYRSVSKFGNTLKRIFLGEKYHISTDLTEEQVEEMYTTIRNSDSEDYTYNPSDQIRIMEGQVFAVHEDGTKTNITKTVAHIGQDNPEGTKGLLTDEIVETHGGGKKV